MVDRYTKAVLTVIAVSLSVIALKGSIPSARAQSDGPVHVILDQIGPGPQFLYGDAIPVKVQQ